MGVATIKEKNMAMGSWYETDASGQKRPVSEPSIHTLVEGQESEILRRAVALGKKHLLKAVAVAVHDEAADGRVFTIRLGQVDDRVMLAVVEHFLKSGVGGATLLLDRNEMRLLAENAESIEIVETATRQIPDEFEPVLSGLPARVEFIGLDQYDEFLVAKSTASAKVRADVFLSGVRTSWSRLAGGDRDDLELGLSAEDAEAVAIGEEASRQSAKVRADVFLSGVRSSWSRTAGEGSR